MWTWAIGEYRGLPWWCEVWTLNRMGAGRSESNSGWTLMKLMTEPA
jgi:hypothetical protein